MSPQPVAQGRSRGHRAEMQGCAPSALQPHRHRQSRAGYPSRSMCHPSEAIGRYGALSGPRCRAVCVRSPATQAQAGLGRGDPSRSMRHPSEAIGRYGALSELRCRAVCRPPSSHTVTGDLGRSAHREACVTRAKRSGDMVRSAGRDARVVCRSGEASTGVRRRSPASCDRGGSRGACLCAVRR